MQNEKSTAIYSGSLAKKIDQLAINEFSHPGYELMTEAGERAFSVLESLQAASEAESSLNLLVLCGAGNNGGDGYVIARCARQAGWSVTLIAAAEAATPDASLAANDYLAAGGKILSVNSEQAENALVGSYDAIVDALVGVGLTSALRSPIDALVSEVNQMSAFKVAIDVPSGVDADTGAVYPPAFQADLTLTFIVPKCGLLTGPALGYVGEVVLLELDIEQEIIDQVEPLARLIHAPSLPSRLSDSHKGSYGHCLVVGGQEGMLGAVLLCGKAALRCGSGKVTVLSTPSHRDKPAFYSPELMSAQFDRSREGGAFDASVLSDADAIALGPGLGLSAWSQEVFVATLGESKPMVVDADALTLLAQSQRQVSAHTILTPHPGEAARLLNCRTAEVQANRIQAAQQISQQYGGVCVLKGAGTVVASAEGAVCLCDKGNPGMATAGMGDVLSGIIVSLLGQGFSAMEAACAGVWIHAKAADDWIEIRSPHALIASDVIEQLPLTLHQLPS